jgi:hypothetical protein
MQFKTGALDRKQLKEVIIKSSSRGPPFLTQDIEGKIVEVLVTVETITIDMYSWVQ